DRIHNSGLQRPTIACAIKDEILSRIAFVDIPFRARPSRAYCRGRNEQAAAQEQCAGQGVQSSFAHHYLPPHLYQRGLSLLFNTVLHGFTHPWALIMFDIYLPRKAVIVSLCDTKRLSIVDKGPSQGVNASSWGWRY